MKRVVAVVGPTGVGKSALALKLARDFNGEIISADSRQIYRGLDIGTAKPSAEEQNTVAHHLIDIADPGGDFSLAQYQELAYKAIDAVALRGGLPLFVGGSGLYVWAVLEGWQIPKVLPDLALRRMLEERAANGESAKLYQELEQLDAGAAGRIDPHNVRRVIRALEITQAPGANSKPAKIKPPFEQLIIGLTASRESLYRRIDERVDDMLSRGLVQEIKNLVSQGYALELPAMSGIGYRQIGFFLQGKISLEEAVQQVKNESHRLVRVQYNWFSPKDDRIKWFDTSSDYYSQVTTLVREFLKEQV